MSEYQDPEKLLLESYFFVKPGRSILSEPDQLLSKYIKFEKLSKRPFVVTIGGPSISGKSSLAIELARHLGVRPVVNTDVIRSTISHYSESLPEVLSVPSHAAFRFVSDTETEESVIEGFLMQCQAMLDPLREITLNAGIHVQNTILEGVHFVPSVVEGLMDIDNVTLIPIYLVPTLSQFESVLLPARTESTYMHRQVGQYASRLNTFRTLIEWWRRELEVLSLPYINNDCDSHTLIRRALTQVCLKLEVSVPDLRDQ